MGIKGFLNIGIKNCGLCERFVGTQTDAAALINMPQNEYICCLSFKIKNIKKIIIIITVFFILSSCKKDKPYEPFVIPCTLTEDSSLAKIFIKGTWEWIEEKRIVQGQDGFSYMTPKTEGYSLKMIIGDSTLRYFNNNEFKDYKYKIQLLGEISGTTFPEDSLPVFVKYRLSDGLREGHVPIKICNGYLLEQYQFVSSNVGEWIWRKL